MTITEAPCISGLCICVVLSAWGGVSRSSVTRVLDDRRLVGKRDENILIQTPGRRNSGQYCFFSPATVTGRIWLTLQLRLCCHNYQGEAIEPLVWVSLQKELAMFCSYEDRAVDLMLPHLCRENLHSTPICGRLVRVHSFAFLLCVRNWCVRYAWEPLVCEVGSCFLTRTVTVSYQ